MTNAKQSKKMRKQGRRQWSSFVDAYWQMISTQTLWMRIKIAVRVLWSPWIYRKGPLRKMRKAMRKAKKRDTRRSIRQFPYPVKA